MINSFEYIGDGCAIISSQYLYGKEGLFDACLEFIDFRDELRRNRFAGRSVLDRIEENLHWKKATWVSIACLKSKNGRILWIRVSNEIEIDVDPIRLIGARKFRLKAGEYRRHSLLAVENVVNRVLSIAFRQRVWTYVPLMVQLLVGAPEKKRPERILLVEAVDKLGNPIGVPYELSLKRRYADLAGIDRLNEFSYRD